MTYANTTIYIDWQDDTQNMLVEFERQIKLSKIKPSPYKYVLNWFITTFEEADAEISNYTSNDQELALA